MPSVTSGRGELAADIHFQVYGDDLPDSMQPVSEAGAHGQGTPVNVVLLMGLQAPLQCWYPQVAELLHQEPRPRLRLCCLDNRGCGASSAPGRLSAYSTHLMAQDILAVMDHLGWQRVHLVGHSMGGMVSTKLAALAPQRVESLTLISATAGRWQNLPRCWRAVKCAWRAIGARTPEQRAAVDLKFHFSKAVLKALHPQQGCLRRDFLQAEYVQSFTASQQPAQPAGLKGQLWAVWSHRVSQREAAAIRAAGFPVLVIHGRHDIVAPPRFGERLARRLAAPCVMLEGAHFVTRERAPEVTQLLAGMLFGQQAAWRPCGDLHRYLDSPAAAPRPLACLPSPQQARSDAAAPAGACAHVDVQQALPKLESKHETC